jgi:NADP-dependent 3-hydroxy acid dehydrogenase YdfG
MSEFEGKVKAFLPHLIASGDGHVINISSLFGLIAVPGQSAYNAAKFAVLARLTGAGYQRIIASAVSRFFPWAKR